MSPPLMRQDIDHLKPSKDYLKRVEWRDGDLEVKGGCTCVGVITAKKGTSKPVNQWVTRPTSQDD